MYNQEDMHEIFKGMQTNATQHLLVTKPTGTGKTAEMLVAEMERGGGMITLNDLSNYHSVWRKPIKGKYKNHLFTLHAARGNDLKESF